jgi:hypothetical protein
MESVWDAFLARLAIRLEEDNANAHHDIGRRNAHVVFEYFSEGLQSSEQDREIFLSQLSFAELKEVH